MDFGGVDRRRTKGDLKMKRKTRVYKRGGQFRSHEANKNGEKEMRDKMGKLIKKKNKKK